VNRTAAVALAAAVLVTLVACSAPAPAPSGTPATPTPTATASVPERPETGVEPWPDHGDFAIDANKAVIPAHNLAEQGKWEDHDYLQRIATMAQARWVGSWELDDRVEGLARAVYEKAAATDRIGLVAYQGMRDYPCERAVAEPELALVYRARTEALVAALPASGARAWIIVEPGLVPDLGSCEGDPRAAWLSDAIGVIADAGAAVYLDAGPDATVAAGHLAGVDLARVAGFAIGTGGHMPDGVAEAEGLKLLTALADSGVDVMAARGVDPGEPGLGFIVDTSRNGAPVADPDPCNAPDAALGKAPRLVTGSGALDAYVWIKRPGESDGRCNGGLDVGQFDVAKALALSQGANAEAA